MSYLDILCYTLIISLAIQIVNLTSPVTNLNIQIIHLEARLKLAAIQEPY